MTIDPAVITAILAFGGLGVPALTQKIKNILNASGAVVIVISAVVSAAGTAFVLYTTDQLTLLAFVLYTLFVTLEANGIHWLVRK